MGKRLHVQPAAGDLDRSGTPLPLPLVTGKGTARAPRGGRLAVLSLVALGSSIVSGLGTGLGSLPAEVDARPLPLVSSTTTDAQKPGVATPGAATPGAATPGAATPGAATP